jgi:hypothetical protein
MDRGAGETLVDPRLAGPWHARGWSPFVPPGGIGNRTTGVMTHGCCDGLTTPLVEIDVWRSSRSDPPE